MVRFIYQLNYLKKIMITHAYIDASNLFYGGKKSLGWSIDYEKLIQYIKYRFEVSKVYYFGGVETCRFPHDCLKNETICLDDLEKYLRNYIDNHKKGVSKNNIEGFNHCLKQVGFYKKLELFGYNLILKPVKTYVDINGKQKQKANCDTEMVFNLMLDRDVFDRALIFSGDGDFLVVLKHLRDVDKKYLTIISNGYKTAGDVKRFAGDKFIDFVNFRQCTERGWCGHKNQKSTLF